MVDKTKFLHILKNVAQKQHGIEHLQKGIRCDLDRLFAMVQEDNGIIPINQIFENQGEEKNVD